VFSRSGVAGGSALHKDRKKSSRREFRAHKPLILCLLCAQIAFLCGCVPGERAAEASYRKSFAAMRTGDFIVSLAEAQTGLRKWPAGDWGWKFRLLCAENLIRLGHSPQASQLLEGVGTPSQPSLHARWLLDRGWILKGAQPDKAKQPLNEALRIALAAKDSELACSIRLHLAELMAIAGKFAEAEAVYRAAVADAERQGDPYLVAWTRIGLGYNRAKASRFDEAVPFLLEAREMAQNVDAKLLLVLAEGNLGWCYLSLGDVDKGMDAYTRGAELSAKIGLRDWQHRCLASIGNIYMQRGDLDRAADYQQRALALARDVGNDPWTAIMLNNLAEISIRKGDLAAAQSFNDQALAIKRRLKEDKWSLAYSELNAADIEARQKRYTQAETDYRSVIRIAEQAHAWDVLWGAYDQLGYLYGNAHRPKLAEAQYRKAIHTIDSEWSKLRSDDFKSTFLAPSHLIGIFQDYVDFLLENGQTGRALEVAESSRARVLSQKLERAQALPPDLHIDKLLAIARASHTVILSYWLGPLHTSVWAIGPSGLSHHPLPPVAEIDKLVQQYTGSIKQGGDPLAHDDGVSSSLYKAVLAPVQALIPPGSNVIVVPDGALHELNFETLVVPEPKPHYWIEDVSISTAPSLRVLRGPDDRLPPSPRSQKLLLFGDPVLRGQEFGPLPNVRKEIAAVESHFPAANRVVFTGTAAVPAEYVKSTPASFTNIHFATHATANRESPLNSAIVFSHQGENYKLYARDVAAVPLTADLVTISACASAGAKAYSGEGLMGFAWAFLQSGARNVIATLWDEDDATSVDLMRGLYDGIAVGQPPAQALRSAKLALVHSSARFHLPYYWGPLEVFTTQIR
jgi:CHAT domain-containing protein/Tfp pilus assembly protein PilF